MSRPRTPGDVAVQQGLAERAEDGSVVFRTPGADPAPSSATTPATAPAQASAPAAEVDLDELARRLYGPLRAQLHAELRLDRERAGLVTDLRS